MPAPVYNTQVPLATQQINQTQAPIQTNFVSIETLVDVNHVDFSDSTNYGKHNFISFVQQASDPATIANELALYSKAVSGSPQLFLRLPNSGALVPLTSTIIETAGPVNTWTTTQWNGWITKIGNTTGGYIAPDTTGTITFPTKFPNNCFAVVACMYINNSTTSPANTMWIIS